jgi:geranylgeranyl diphosphate synthase type II
MNYENIFDNYINLINKELENFLPKVCDTDKTIEQAMAYSLFSGGKRIRPVLMLAVCDMFSYDLSDAISFACAIEMIHTYSLIHDDLPAMDNDDLRRGKPTNHKVYGEGMAILAGDALLNKAFEVMIESIVKDPQNAHKKALAMNIVAISSGLNGMIGGQVIDLESEGVKTSEETLRRMHSLKTGALLKAPVLAAAFLAEVSQEEKNILGSYASNIGLAFQIKDDILDVEGETEKIGKKCGSDVNNNKSTFVSLHGLEKSKMLLRNITNEAITQIEYFGTKNFFLKELALRLSERIN